MGKKKHIKRVFTIGASVVLGLGILSSGVVRAETGPSLSSDRRVMVLESARQNYLASQRAEKLRDNLIKASASTPLVASNDPGKWLRRVKISSVNMVTNRFCSDEQKVVKIDGRDFYVPSDGYAFTLSQNPSLRYAVDPFTGKKIEKSGALAYVDSKDRVLYFESQESYGDFIALLSR